MLLGKRTRTAGCTRGVRPDRRCSPGAVDPRLTPGVICSTAFHTGSVRRVTDAVKRAVLIEYGMAPAAYGRSIEIDHIVSLELGGSNHIANLFPQSGSGAASYHLKDVLENRLHALVCAGTMRLADVQRGIARNWTRLYTTVFGVRP